MRTQFKPELSADYRVGYNRGYRNGTYRPNTDLPPNYSPAQLADYDKGFDNGNADYWANYYASIGE